MCFARRNYLWITGDDANLLSQANMTSKGFVPNIDFASGYPGLGAKLQSYIVSFVGFTPLSEHIFSAILASMTGIFFFYIFYKKDELIIFLCLIFIYSQTFLNNPTPNPGHIFTICFIILIHLFHTRKFVFLFYQILIALILTISIFSKQYGIFALAFVISYTFLNTKNQLTTIQRYVIFAIAWLGLFLSYIISISKSKSDFIYFVIIASPIFLTILLSKSSRISFENSKINKKYLIQATLAFVIFCFIFWTLIYGFNNPINVIREVLILFPQAINSNIVKYSFGFMSFFQSIFAFLFFIISQKISDLGQTASMRYKYWRLTLLVAAILCLKYIGNLSATVFVAFCTIIIWYFYKKASLRLDILLLVIPYFIILLPYPNFAYFVSIFSYLFINSTNEKRIDVNIYSLRIPLGLLTFSLMSILATSYVVHESNWLDTLPTYTYSNLSFISADPGWSDEIAKLSLDPSGICESWGCTYLKLQNNQNPLVGSNFLLPYWAKSGHEHPLE